MITIGWCIILSSVKFVLEKAIREANIQTRSTQIYVYSNFSICWWNRYYWKIRKINPEFVLCRWKLQLPQWIWKSINVHLSVINILQLGKYVNLDKIDFDLRRNFSNSIVNVECKLLKLDSCEICKIFQIWLDHRENINAIYAA